MSANPRLSRANIDELATLYKERDELERARGYADEKNFWIGVVNDAFHGTGTRSSVQSAIGGTGELATVLQAAVVADFDERIKAVNGDIEAAGGAP